MTTMGSSPLARGLLQYPTRHQQPRRIIPARAGFTRSPETPPTARPDHPRSRGVYNVRMNGSCVQSGSSPLARGLRRLRLLRADAGRIIPARAGFTRLFRGDAGQHRDHPRSRGVYVGGGLDVVGDPGIIPARAGFTSPPAPRWCASPDHPRSRGVYHEVLSPFFSLLGSSPLARGLRIVLRHLAVVRGIIPARAGFTGTTERNCMPPRDHPRSRGVYSTYLWPPLLSSGSSPLARGLQLRLRLLRYPCGIIPARAGFTVAEWMMGIPYGDHPRSRGVYS